MNRIDRKIFRGILEKKLSEDDVFSDSDDEDYRQEPHQTVNTGSNEYRTNININIIFFNYTYSYTKLH